MPASAFPLPCCLAFAVALAALAPANGQSPIRINACAGTPVELQAPAGFRLYAWTPSAGIPNPQSRTITVTPRADATYAVTYERAPDANIVVNPGFEDGNTGFTSEYRYVPGGTFEQGSYAILTNPQSFNRGFSNCTDPSGGRSNMYVADGATRRGAKAWCQRVTVEPGRRYAFSLAVASLVSANPPLLSFTIGDERVGTANLPRSTCDWQRFFTIWTAPADASEVDICIVNDNETPDGNDFALDDVQLLPLDPRGPQTTVYEVTLNRPRTATLDTLLCAGQRYTGNGLDLAAGETAVARLNTTVGCDSFLTVNTSVAAPVLTEEFNTTSCRGSVVEFENLTLTRDTVIVRRGTSTRGCDSTYVFTLRFFDRTALRATVTEPSCAGDTTGSAVLSIDAGVAPYSIRWINGQSDSVLSDVAAGTYAVRVRDADGCTAETTVRITEPAAIDIVSVTPSSAACADESSGSAAFEATGGTGALAAVALDAAGQRRDPLRLPGGEFVLRVSDEEGCFAERPFTVSAPEGFDLSLLGDSSVALGQTARAVLLIGGDDIRTRWDYDLDPVDSLVNDDRLSFVPAFGGLLRVVGTDQNGCDVETTLAIRVRSGRRSYFPTAFSPDGDGVNDSFGPASSAAVARVARFEVYNRWGGLVFSASNCDVSDPACAWNGQQSGDGAGLNPGVYAYVAVLELIDGTVLRTDGPVTLVR